ncbi:hypothetical protein ES703_18275 [subsurface metagenome]
MNNENEGGARIQLSGLWKQQSKAGKTYYSGSLGPNAQLQLFPNEYKKEGDNRPDLILYLVKREPKKKPEEIPASEDPGDESVPF